MDQNSKNIERVKQIFRNYLQINEYRKTPERFAILEEIYSREDHFDAEALYIQMKTRNYRVSRATVYNTLDSLVEAGLAKRVMSGKGPVRYDARLDNHHHLICSNTKEIIDFYDEELNQMIKSYLEKKKIKAEELREKNMLTVYDKISAKKRAKAAEQARLEKELEDSKVNYEQIIREINEKSEE